MKRMVTFIGFVIALIATGLSAYMFHQNYWRWRDCFNENGRCFVAEDGVVYSAQSGLVYALSLIVFSILTVLLFRKLRRLNPDKNA